MPAMEMKLINMISEKANKEKTEATLELKEDKVYTEAMNKRLMQLEETVEKLNQMMNPDQGDDEKDGEGDGKTKTGAPKKMTVSIEQFNALSMKVDFNERKLTEMIASMQNRLTAFDDKTSETFIEHKKMIEELEKKVKAMEKSQMLMAAAGSSGAADEDDKDAGMGAEIFKEIEQRLDKHDTEIERLLRVDFRLNKELVQKPYDYINKVKEELSSEQRSIVKIIKVNNDKYLTKIGSIDTRLNEVYVDSKKIIHDYRKNLEGIRRDKQTIKQLHENVELIIGKFG